MTRTDLVLMKVTRALEEFREKIDGDGLTEVIVSVKFPSSVVFVQPVLKRS